MEGSGFNDTVQMRMTTTLQYSNTLRLQRIRYDTNSKTNKQICKQANKRTNKQTNKQTLIPFCYMRDDRYALKRRTCFVTLLFWSIDSIVMNFSELYCHVRFHFLNERQPPQYYILRSEFFRISFKWAKLAGRLLSAVWWKGKWGVRNQ